MNHTWIEQALSAGRAELTVHYMYAGFDARVEWPDGDEIVRTGGSLGEALTLLDAALAADAAQEMRDAGAV
jgi:fermentation-respiration switch protein FrsA (DUF1100 family)